MTERSTLLCITVLRRLRATHISLFKARCWRECKIKQSRRGRREELAAYVTRKTTTYKLPLAPLLQERGTERGGR